MPAGTRPDRGAAPIMRLSHPEIQRLKNGMHPGAGSLAPNFGTGAGASLRPGDLSHSIACQNTKRP